MGTEAKSPREIAEELKALLLWENLDCCKIMDLVVDNGEAIVQTLSYAAERERLLCEADAVIVQTRWRDTYHERWHQEAAQRFAERQGLSSHPATEGKREDE